MTDTTIRYLRRADHDPGAEWPDFYREARLAETAGLRHASRVSATMGAALQAASSVVPSYAAGDPVYEKRKQRLAEVLILLDLGGVGGRGGYSGGATRRMPWARGLGTSRWQAGDGSAWYAAAQDAVGEAPAISLDDAADLFCLDLLEDSHEWTTAYAARRVLGAETPEEAHAWDEVRATCQRWWDLEEEDKEAEHLVALVLANIARGLDARSARKDLDLTPLAVSYLLDRISPDFLCEGDRYDAGYTDAEEIDCLPKAARAILCPHGNPPEIRIPSGDGGPKVEIVRRG